MFLVRDDADAGAALAAARAQFALSGFTQVDEHRWPSWVLLHSPYVFGGPATFWAEGETLAAVAGTLSVDGQMGEEALRRLAAMPLPAPEWDRIGGQFAALVRQGGRTFLFTDYFAAFQLFHDGEQRLFTTSLLAAAAALPRLHWDAQGVYELAFSVAPIGDDTVFAELKRLGPDAVLEPQAGGVVRHADAKPLPPIDRSRLLAERLETARARLAEAVAGPVGWFGDRIRCPLSGGLDSRLLLAALRAEGAAPHVYVYGGRESPDVRIARAIGAAQGFPVQLTDRADAAISPDAFPAAVARNFHEFDGLPSYGNIFDNGANLVTRDERHAGGALAASGGCGEIYRDFFYLADRPFTNDAVARTFFAQFTAGDATGLFDGDAFLRRIADKIGAALGLPPGTHRLERGIVEHIYPRVRCRALFGREISAEARWGAYLMPFLDHRVVADAMTLPLPLKRAGRFEAALIAAIDPALAAQPSAYGHDFAGPPSRHHRLSEWSTRARPVWLRQASYGIKRRLGRMDDEHGGLMAPDYLRRVLDPELPAMRRFFHVERVADAGLWRRLANLQYLAEHLGSKLAG